MLDEFLPYISVFYLQLTLYQYHSYPPYFYLLPGIRRALLIHLLVMDPYQPSRSSLSHFPGTAARVATKTTPTPLYDKVARP